MLLIFLNLYMLHDLKSQREVSKVDGLTIYFQKKSYFLDKTFLDDLVALTNTNGSFCIHLRNYNPLTTSYNNVVLLFQIGLPILNIETLKLIQTRLKCGSIASSGSKCNFVISSQTELLYVIKPIFSFFKLNKKKKRAVFNFSTSC